ncbi:MAG: tRNA adenosine(34) deaminase TadA [Deltaproteobacteria bacterium]|nr:tRNA adenosine(34) deaminase TadA [Deltaproteobacteria bacterium]
MPVKIPLNINDEEQMLRAISQAKRAEGVGDVPIGAVLTAPDGKVVARGYNRKEASNDPTHHAEIAVLRTASKKLGRWRLQDLTIYVTLEPCVMCMGALIQARIKRLVFAAPDPKAGACGSIFDISNDKRLNHSIKVTSGVLEDEASKMLKDFFKKLRESKKGRKG